MMARYRSKPIEVEALQFQPSVWRECEAFAPDQVQAVGNWKHENDVLCMAVGMHIRGASHGRPRVNAIPGDWLVKGDDGEVKVVRQADFPNQFESAAHSEPSP